MRLNWHIININILISLTLPLHCGSRSVYLILFSYTSSVMCSSFVKSASNFRRSARWLLKHKHIRRELKTDCYRFIENMLELNTWMNACVVYSSVWVFKMKDFWRVILEIWSRHKNIFWVYICWMFSKYLVIA